ncbi:helix-turn-helix transcriptional regulator [Pricia sp. S334]|uniref:Helix-turn-helix transcriptional regulator n=1 Tax=Pricia mediterranea TaxID=3076079 RepID=A0ABU3L7F3_9FLAO|nr:helix-turn-helix transcriptional regulator [Pricia sp. S334]MDT7829675.1 helix-turn-helix transcriptional regulator [Pricia sp. S334]
MGRSFTTLALLLLWTIPAYPSPTIESAEAVSTTALKGQETRLLLEKADNLYLERQFSEAIKTYGLVLENDRAIKAPVLKKIALSHAALNHVQECVAYLERALVSEFNPAILVDGRFDSIRDTEAFNELADKYTPTVNLWSFLYLYAALIGFYISIMLNFNNKIDPVARTLISLFVFIHSVFILHICISITHYEYQFPHSYLMSTAFSFLYGPLLYFYFKRITRQYRFRIIDLLHLVPTVLFLIYLIPIYALPASEKLQLLVQDANDGFSVANLTVTTIKLTSLIVYGYFIRKIYLRGKQRKGLDKSSEIWKKNLYRIHFLYIISYTLYCVFITNDLPLFHSQVICMALMVLYVGYSASVQPNVFSGNYAYANQFFPKYKKSGLTDSLSRELMQSLVHLFSMDKIYKENDICLEMVAHRLNTTRHNASQVINEHFDMNFHELVNKYRIQEAKSILDGDRQKNLNIIDVAYEVGYNNKVTFNKAFKKDTKLTPSEYQKIAIDRL